MQSVHFIKSITEMKTLMTNTTTAYFESHVPNKPSSQSIILRAINMVVAATVFAVLSFTALAQEEKTSIEFAVAGPMSGPDAHLGRAMADAARLRIEEFNANGGLNGRLVELVEYDDKNDPVVAAKIAEEISTNSNALLVLGHRTSGASIAAAPIYDKNEITAITGTATADNLTINHPWYFRVIYNNELQADFIMSYANSILKFKHVTLLASDTAYGKSLAKAFRNSAKQLPIKITHDYNIESADPDIDLRMAEIVSDLSLAPDSGMVILAMSAQNAAFFVKEMRNSGFTFPIFGPDSITQRFPDNFEADPVLKTSPGDFTNKVLATTSMIWDVANETAVRFRNSFRALYGKLPDSGMALYYDATSIALEAVLKGGLTGTNLSDDRAKIKSYLSSINEQAKAFSGITGKIHFDDHGNAIKAVSVGVFQSEEFISAPVQFEPVLDPTKVPNFSDKREKGEIVRFRNGYMHATQIVYTGVDIIEISNLDTATGTYVLDFYIWLRFRDDLELDKIQFTNAAADIKLTNPIWSRERDGMTVLTYKVRGTFHGDFVFKEYPFDKQEIVLEIRHRDRTRESLSFVADRLGMRLSGENVTFLDRIQAQNVFRTSPGWQVVDASVFQDLIKTASTLGETLFFKGETDVNFSRLKLNVTISRNLSSYSTTILLPMAILFIIGLCLFAVPIEELPPRLSGGILLLVTVSLLRARLSNDLPNIGYLVAIDYVFFALQIVMWFGIVVSIMSFWCMRKERLVLASRINFAGACLYPLPVISVFFAIWFFIFYS